MRGSCAGYSGTGTLRGITYEMRLPKMGSTRREAPSSCTSQLACPSQVRRKGSPTAGGVARRCTSAGTTGTWAVGGLFRLRPASLSSTAQRKTIAPALGPLPSWFRKRNMRSLYRVLSVVRVLHLGDALLRLGQACFLVDEVEAHPQHRGDHRHQDGGE